MTQTTWLMLAIAVVAVVVGFLAGRLSAPRERQFQETRSELERVQKERDELQDSVESHFQHTAALFGNLSRDYRALYLHFAEGARSMGLGEEPARRLIEQARAPAEEQAPEATADALDPADTPAAPAEPEAAAEEVPERPAAGTGQAAEAAPEGKAGDAAATAAAGASGDSGGAPPAEAPRAARADGEAAEGEAPEGEARGERTAEPGAEPAAPRRDAAG